MIKILALSASLLTPSQEEAIKLGWHAPYKNEIVEKVIDFNLPPKNVRKYEFQDRWDQPANKWMWATFLGLQLADIHSTREGMKYRDIREVNPLLPERPSTAQIALFKLAVTLPAYNAVGFKNISNRDLLFPIMFSAAVVQNNYRLVSKAKRKGA